MWFSFSKEGRRHAEISPISCITISYEKERNDWFPNLFSDQRTRIFVWTKAIVARLMECKRGSAHRTCRFFCSNGCDDNRWQYFVVRICTILQKNMIGIQIITSIPTEGGKQWDISRMETYLLFEWLTIYTNISRSRRTQHRYISNIVLLQVMHQNYIWLLVSFYSIEIRYEPPSNAWNKTNGCRYLFQQVVQCCRYFSMRNTVFN